MLLATQTTSVVSPIGTIVIRGNERGIVDVSFAEEAAGDAADAPGFLADCRRQLLEYFAGTRKRFDDLPLAPRATDFQRAVWDRAAEVPFGMTAEYGTIARDIGSPDAARAVGTALGRNPICIIIPCHRIIAADDHGGGYAGGMWKKEWLLRHERDA